MLVQNMIGVIEVNRSIRARATRFDLIKLGQHVEVSQVGARCGSQSVSQTGNAAVRKSDWGEMR